MSMLKKKIIKFIWTAWFAFGHFLITIAVFNNVAGRSMIAATAINFAVILFFIIEDLVSDHFYAKHQAKKQHKKPNIFKKIVAAYFTSVSFKTSLYLFYIFILVCSAIDTVDPGFFSEDFSLYLLTVEYGILVLVAVDTFLGQFLKDVVTR